MGATTVFALLAAVLLSAALAYFQYFYKTATRKPLHYGLAALRFLALFGLLLLLINPRIKSVRYDIVKTPLAIVADNSSSIQTLDAQETLRESFQQLLLHKDLAARFEVLPYVFDATLKSSDSLSFDGQRTHIYEVARGLNAAYRNRDAAAVLLTDGNQTQGADYVYAFDNRMQVHPIILGDTARVADLRIGQINVNRYVFTGNQFPAEVFVHYSGHENVSAQLSVKSGNTMMFRESVSLGPNKRAAVVQALLQANKGGVQTYEVSINAPINERHTANNHKKMAVEVIDQRSDIAIVSGISHPDIAALVRAIGSNAQRRVTVFSPAEFTSAPQFNAVILYQPDASFAGVWDAIESARKNVFVITGPHTDFSLLNARQSFFEYRMSPQREQYRAAYNTRFGAFGAKDIGFQSFAPLDHPFGNIASKEHSEALLSAVIRNIPTAFPLLAVGAQGSKRAVFLHGEGLWKWRLASHKDAKSFEPFDTLVDQLIQYITTDARRESLVVTHERFYQSGDPIQIGAQYFDDNFKPDPNAKLSIEVRQGNGGAIRHYDLLKSGEGFEAKLDGLAAGSYDFWVRELRSKSVYKGHFEVIAFEAEAQFVNPDVERLEQLARQSGTQVRLPAQTDALIASLLENPAYQPVQKAYSSKRPLIDFVWLLIMVAGCFAAEWLLRKYNGLL